MSAVRKYQEDAQREKDLNLSGLEILKNKLLEISGADNLKKHFSSFQVNQKEDLDLLTKTLLRMLGYNWTNFHPYKTDDKTAPTLVPRLEDIIPFVFYIEPSEQKDLRITNDHKWTQWYHDRENNFLHFSIITNFKDLQVFGAGGKTIDDLDIDFSILLKDYEEERYSSKEFKKWKKIYGKFNSRKVNFNEALNRNKKIAYITGLEYQKKFGNEPYAQPPKGIGEDGKGYERLFKTRRSLPFFQKEVIDFGNPDNPLENKIIWGDNLAIMRDLPDESIDLIYIDPPFFSGRNYNYIFQDKSEVKTFTDIWDEGLDGYLIWMNARLWEMKRLLKPTGSILVHVDWHASHYIKCELDKIFGYAAEKGKAGFMNEIIWSYSTYQGQVKDYFPRKHDTIFWYTNGKEAKFNLSYHDNYEDTVDYNRWKKYYKDGNKIYYGEHPKSDSRFTSYLNKWIKTNERKPEEGELIYECRGHVIDSVLSVKAVDPKSDERVGYETQKPERLLEILINSLTDNGDLIADFFCGGGTTVAVAEKLGRKWITTDISRIAIATARDRIASIYDKDKENVGIKKLSDKALKNFEVQYHGSYERKDIFALSNQEHIEFILKCYGAKPEKDGHSIHGYKSNSERQLTAIHVDLSRKKIERETIEKFHRSIENRSEDYPNGGIILCWGYSKSAHKYVRECQKSAYTSPLQLIRIDLVDIDGPDFIDSNVRFINTPTANFQVVDQKGLTVDFDATTSIGEDSKVVVYYQWDFDFKGTFRPTSKTSFTKDDDGDGNPLNDNRVITYEFSKKGRYKVALRIFDEDGGTSEVVKTLEV